MEVGSLASSPLENSEREQISIHNVEADDTRDPEDGDDAVNLRFDVPPFRHMFFRYSMYGKSEVVKTSSTVYASHHRSEIEWLQITKLSFALLGHRNAPNLTFFAPTVKELYFLGHISYPTTAFKMMQQLPALTNVKFNIGVAGSVNEFYETPEDLNEMTPEIPSVTSLEVMLNARIYRCSSDNIRSIFGKIITSVIKHSKDSFPNLENLSINVPNIPEFMEKVIDLVTSRAHLSSTYLIKVVETSEWGHAIKVTRRIPIHEEDHPPLTPGQAFAIQQFYNACNKR